MMLMYTIFSTPYSALSGVLTANSQDRTSVKSIRFIFAFTCGFFVNYFTLDLVSHFGEGDDAKGWQMTMGLYSLVAAAIFALTFFSTRERVEPPTGHVNNPLQDVRDLTKIGRGLSFLGSRSLSC